MTRQYWLRYRYPRRPTVYRELVDDVELPTVLDLLFFVKAKMISVSLVY